MAFCYWTVWRQLDALQLLHLPSFYYQRCVFIGEPKQPYKYNANTFPGLGQWTSPQAQALTVPCYVLGAGSYLIVARLSDAHQMRGLYQVIFASVCIIGYGLSIARVGPAVHYFATFVISLGLFVAVGLPLAWLPSNNPRYGKRTTASAIQITICNCSGIVAPFVSLFSIPNSKREVHLMLPSFIQRKTVRGT